MKKKVNITSMGGKMIDGNGRQNKLIFVIIIITVALSMLLSGCSTTLDYFSYNQEIGKFILPSENVIIPQLNKDDHNDLDNLQFFLVSEGYQKEVQLRIFGNVQVTLPDNLREVSLVAVSPHWDKYGQSITAKISTVISTVKR